MARLLISIAIVVFGASSLQAAAQDKSKGSDTVRKAVILDFADHLSTIPVEYHADLLFSMLSKEPTAFSEQSQSRLLRELFERASTAQNQAPVSEATRLPNSLSHQRALDSFTLPFDTLDIQARAVSLLQNRSPALAWVLLQQISLPTRRSDCTDSLVPNFAPYYRVMASSLNGLKSTTLPDGRTKLAYLLQQIDGIKTPEQLQAFATVVGILDLGPDEEAPLLGAIVSRVGSIDGSDREMFGADNEDTGHSLMSSIAGLLGVEKAHDISPVSLLLAYRAFLVRNLHGAACADSTSDRIEAAARFNALNPELIGEHPKPVSALSSQELTPTSFAGAAQDDIIEADKGVAKQLRRIGQIFMANQRALYQSDSMEEYLQPSPEDVQDVLRHLKEGSTDDRSSSLLRFEEQMAALHILVIALPLGPSLKDAIDTEIALLNLNPVEQQYPLPWLRYFRQLLFISRPTTVDAMNELRRRGKRGEYMTMLPSPEATFIRETLHRYQADPIIAAYLSYEDIFRPLYEPE